MSRSIDGESQRAYRVVKENGMSNDTQEARRVIPERDKLATLAEEAHEEWCADNESSDPWGGASWEYVADAIIAAGYRANEAAK